MSDPHSWERVEDTVYRFRVPGGWLYQVTKENEPCGFHTPVFVPYSNTTEDAWLARK